MFCDVRLVHPNPDCSDGFFVWVGVKTLVPEIAEKHAMSFLAGEFVSSVNVEGMEDMKHEDFQGAEEIQQVSGRAYYGTDEQ